MPVFAKMLPPPGTCFGKKHSLLFVLQHETLGVLISIQVAIFENKHFDILQKPALITPYHRLYTGYIDYCRGACVQVSNELPDAFGVEKVERLPCTSCTSGT